MNDKTRWCSDAQWSKDLHAENCHFCTATDASRGEGLLIQELPSSRLILSNNQHIRGYSILVLKSHHIELHDLAEDLAITFLKDLRASTAAISRAFSPRKLNIEIQGNQAPHLHAHIKPRYPDDEPAHARISHTTPVLELDPESAAKRVLAIRSALNWRHS